MHIKTSKKGEDNYDSYAFRFFLKEAFVCGWMCPHDTVFCDKATIHKKGYNRNLSHFLWETLGLDGEPLNILLVTLPKRSPELNPIELIWKILCMRMRG